jgi:hypothetical protein
MGYIKYDVVLLNEDTGFYIPFDTGNTMYQEFLRWQELGGILQDASGTPTSSYPKVAAITIRQAKLILLQEGMLDDIETLIAGLPRSVQIEWEYASEIFRDNPLLSNAGLSDEKLDELFYKASKL